MKKLGLRLDDLNVETFETQTAERKPRGTVQGAMDTASCPGYSCAPTCGIVISPGLADVGMANASFRNCCV
jgi:hypothetical protein